MINVDQLRVETVPTSQPPILAKSPVHTATHLATSSLQETITGEYGTPSYQNPLAATHPLRIGEQDLIPSIIPPIDPRRIGPRPSELAATTEQMLEQQHLLRERYDLQSLGQLNTPSTPSPTNISRPPPRTQFNTRSGHSPVQTRRTRNPTGGRTATFEQRKVLLAEYKRELMRRHGYQGVVFYNDVITLRASEILAIYANPAILVTGNSFNYCTKAEGDLRKTGQRHSAATRGNYSAVNRLSLLGAGVSVTRVMLNCHRDIYKVWSIEQNAVGKIVQEPALGTVDKQIALGMADQQLEVGINIPIDDVTDRCIAGDRIRGEPHPPLLVQQRMQARGISMDACYCTNCDNPPYCKRCSELLSRVDGWATLTDDMGNKEEGEVPEGPSETFLHEAPIAQAPTAAQLIQQEAYWAPSTPTAPQLIEHEARIAPAPTDTQLAQQQILQDAELANQRDQLDTSENQMDTEDQFEDTRQFEDAIAPDQLSNTPVEWPPLTPNQLVSAQATIKEEEPVDELIIHDEALTQEIHDMADDQNMNPTMPTASLHTAIEPPPPHGFCPDAENKRIMFPLGWKNRRPKSTCVCDFCVAAAPPFVIDDYELGARGFYATKTVTKARMDALMRKGSDFDLSAPDITKVINYGGGSPTTELELHAKLKPWLKVISRHGYFTLDVEGWTAAKLQEFKHMYAETEHYSTAFAYTTLTICAPDGIMLQIAVNFDGHKIHGKHVPDFIKVLLRNPRIRRAGFGIFEDIRKLRESETVTRVSAGSDLNNLALLCWPQNASLMHKGVIVADRLLAHHELLGIETGKQFVAEQLNAPRIYYNARQKNRPRPRNGIGIDYHDLEFHRPFAAWEDYWVAYNMYDHYLSHALLHAAAQRLRFLDTKNVNTDVIRVIHYLLEYTRGIPPVMLAQGRTTLDLWPLDDWYGKNHQDSGVGPIEMRALLLHVHQPKKFHSTKTIMDELRHGERAYVTDWAAVSDDFLQELRFQLPPSTNNNIITLDNYTTEQAMNKFMRSKGEFFPHPCGLCESYDHSNVTCSTQSPQCHYLLCGDYMHTMGVCKLLNGRCEDKRCEMLGHTQAFHNQYSALKLWEMFRIASPYGAQTCRLFSKDFAYQYWPTHAFKEVRKIRLSILIPPETNPGDQSQAGTMAGLLSSAFVLALPTTEAKIRKRKSTQAPPAHPRTKQTRVTGLTVVQRQGKSTDQNEEPDVIVEDIRIIEPETTSGSGNVSGSYDTTSSSGGSTGQPTVTYAAATGAAPTPPTQDTIVAEALGSAPAGMTRDEKAHLKSMIESPSPLATNDPRAEVLRTVVTHTTPSGPVVREKSIEIYKEDPPQ